MQVHAIQPGFAAQATGIDLSKPTNTALVDEIWRAIDTYAVLVFPDQNLTDLQLRDFAVRFGPLEIGRSAARGGKRRLALPEIGVRRHARRLRCADAGDAGQPRQLGDRARCLLVARPDRFHHLRTKGA